MPLSVAASQHALHSFPARARQTTSAAGLCAVIGVAVVSLQGCSVKFNERNSESQLQVCPGFKFHNNGYVSETRWGDVVNVTCPTDQVYAGPEIVCSWVDRFCIAYSKREVNPKFCYNQYNLTAQGEGLSEWPRDIEPKIMQPPPPGSNLTFPPGFGAGRFPGNLSRFNFSSFPRPGVAGSAPGGLRRVAGRRLTGSLPRVVSPTQLQCKEEAFVDLDFEAAKVSRPNEDGAERDSQYPWSLRYKNIAQVNGRKVDLLITSTHSDISAKPERNGKGSAMGRININSKVTVPLRFMFVESGLYSPVALNKVFFTLFDITDRSKAENDKQITVQGMSEYFVSKKTNIAVTPLGGGRYRFGSTSWTPRAPALPVGQVSVKQMWLDSLNRSAVFLFRNTSEFLLYVRANPAPLGRDLEFTGWSEVASIGKKVIVYNNKMQAKFGLPDGVEVRRGSGGGGQLDAADVAGAICFAAALVVGSAAFLAVVVRRRHARQPVPPSELAAAQHSEEGGSGAAAE